MTCATKSKIDQISLKRFSIGVPVIASRPYGIIVDNQDKIWWADYHNGGVSRFAVARANSPA